MTPIDDRFVGSPPTASSGGRAAAVAGSSRSTGRLALQLFIDGLLVASVLGVPVAAGHALDLCRTRAQGRYAVGAAGSFASTRDGAVWMTGVAAWLAPGAVIFAIWAIVAAWATRLALPATPAALAVVGAPPAIGLLVYTVLTWPWALAASVDFAVVRSAPRLIDVGELRARLADRPGFRRLVVETLAAAAVAAALIAWMAVDGLPLWWPVRWVAAGLTLALLGAGTAVRAGAFAAQCYGLSASAPAALMRDDAR